MRLKLYSLWEKYLFLLTVNVATITQNQNQNQASENQVKKTDQLGFWDRILWQPLANKIERKIVEWEDPGDSKTYKPLLATTSNQVLLHIKQPKPSSKYPKMSFTYFVPTYIRLIIKNFTNIDHSKLQAQANVSIMITFVYGNKHLLKLPEQVAARLYNEVVLNFERDESLRLTRENDNISVKQKQEKHEITFTVRRKVHMRIVPDIHYTPFEKLELLLPITIQQLPAKTMLNPPIKKNALQKKDLTTKYEAIVKFNFMDRPKTKLITIDYKNQSNFGNYSLIQNSLCAKYSNEVIKSRRQQELSEKQKISETRNSCDENNKIKNFQYASFQATIYKQPLASLFNIFLPLWGLAFINLVIYFQSPDLADRIASLATLMVAFIALDDNIRIQIPPHPQVLFVQWLVYAQITASLICLGHSFALRNVPVDKKRDFDWLQEFTLGLSCAVLATQILLVIGRTLYHYKVEVPNFGLSPLEKGWQSYKGRTEFNHLFWTNQQCNEDAKFKQIIANNPKRTLIYNSEWTRKLQDLNDDIKRRSAQITFTYIKPNNSMMPENQQPDIIANSHLLNQR